jgi:hypothetical protein
MFIATKDSALCYTLHKILNFIQNINLHFANFKLMPTQITAWVKNIIKLCLYMLLRQSDISAPQIPNAALLGSGNICINMKMPKACIYCCYAMYYVSSKSVTDKWKCV